MQRRRTDRRFWALACCAACLACACGDSTTDTKGGDGALIDAASWTLVARQDDPFANRATEASVCEPSGYGTEPLDTEVAFGVETDQCNFITVTQPSRIGVAAGAGLGLRLWHFELDAPEPAEAYAAVALGEQVVWEERIPIPSDSGMVIGEWTATGAIEPGAPVTFHLDNHGENSWALLSISLTDP